MNQYIAGIKNKYYGCGFDVNGKLKSDWNCDDIVYDSKNNGFRYFGEGRVYDANSQFLKVWGTITFQKEISFGNIFMKNKYSRGTGIFIDFNLENEMSKRIFYLDRIKKSDLSNFINKDRVSSQDDISKLIQAFNQARNTMH